jgi:CheY-like chemotaxis protein
VATQRKRKSILLVDEDQYFLNIASIVLNTMANCDIHCCNSGPEAIAIAASQTPDLILLAVTMRGMDGVATLATLRSLPNTKTVPALFIVGSEVDYTNARCRELGVIGAISRAIAPLILPERVLELWERAPGWRAAQAHVAPGGARRAWA